MNAPSHRLIKTTSLLALIFFCLWLTQVAILGHHLALVFIPCLITVFAAAKKPYRKGFIAACVLVGLFILSPFEVGVKRGDHLQVKVQPIDYGLKSPEDYRELERQGIASGGCVVTPYSAQWRLLVIVP